ncbi:hypothetical protein CA13_40300 [Planctomycetes bacterium CA13]|uniref:PEP-CTERM protein-sorting domain-containing protein n=1 Tax=Novipirellula herctigrandis TaxID=2527986 RepID=A0A5C5Z672_9BACT|nr:hypothetical protein CA13_40300 [Planctomycetes bacterium CA13]
MPLSRNLPSLLLLLSCLVVATSAPSHADLIIDISDASIIGPDTQAVIDVTVTSDLPPFDVLPDGILNFLINFDLTPVMGGTNLEFPSSYPDIDVVTGLEAYMSNDTSYLFYDDPTDSLDMSQNVATDTNALDWISSSEVDVSDFSGLDGPLFGVEVNNENSFLLTRLYVDLPPGMTTSDFAPGSTFTVSLDDDGADASEFTDAFFGDLVYSSTSGTITVSAVPEPGSLAVLGLFAIGGVWQQHRRRKRSIDG